MDGTAPLPEVGQLEHHPTAPPAAALVRSRPLFEGGLLPLLVEPQEPGVDLVTWAKGQRDSVDEQLLYHGGILFRGFGIRSAAQLKSFIHTISGEVLEYRERSSPRSSVEGRIYTSTDYPPKYPIFLHNENSYQRVWPRRIYFFCLRAAEEGGETPIADCRRVLAQIDPAVRARFADKGWMYVRNFGDGFGLDWRTVFQTGDRAAVEAHCHQSGIAIEWRDGERLRTRAVRPALTRHPRTGEELWFNHATFFHISTLPEEIRSGLVEEFDEADLPANTYYGDGSLIEPEVLDHLRSIYERETVRFPWQEGDILLLDNMLVAHGRAPFRGERKILVGMSDPVELISPTG